ncbi:hypothetical protein RGQ29_030321 [Quercus rubra]|uniref:Uncharacterized protein n=1 Tax=Quercus rubra TaxID=3512 RepID=A0AAN7EHA1_QUERU|nr:hypothetical protein RGQ29_030321 [Quercus rubra]
MVSQSESFSRSECDNGTAKELEEKIKSNTTTAGEVSRKKVALMTEPKRLLAYANILKDIVLKP